jgi:hypothetical protein
MKKYIAPFFLVAVIGNVQAAEITETHVTGTRFKFTAKLDAPLIAGNKVKIEFGKNLVPMTCAETTCTLFRTMNSDVMPTYKIGIYNSKNVLQSKNLEANSTTTLPAYTKIANDGSELLDSAKLGSNPKDWACTKDNKTGLIWEVKTPYDELRDVRHTYTNYSADYSKCDDAGADWCDSNSLTGKYGDNTNTDGFVTTVNSQSLCNAKDWRIPTKGELISLILCSDGKYNFDRSCTNHETVTDPSINTTYFPDTTYIPFTPYFLSSSSVDEKRDEAWTVVFTKGFISNGYKRYQRLNVRLVRNAQ